MTASLTDLRRELDEWAASGKTARFWWRDEDAVRDTPGLRRAIEIAHTAGIVFGLAVIPENSDDTLARLTASAPLQVWQHGWAHSDYGDGEFGHARPLDAMMRDATDGRRRLDKIFGPGGWEAVFVPPFHLLSMP